MLILDVEIAFLHVDLYDDIYMVLPTRYHLLPKNKNHLHKIGYRGPIHQAKMNFCAKLSKDLYSLVQAAWQWWKKFITDLTCVGFIKGEVDPCLLYRRDKHGLCIVIVYVDDCLCIGDKKALNTTVHEIQKIF